MGPPTIDPRDYGALYNSGITEALFYLDDGRPVFDNQQIAPHVPQQDYPYQSSTRRIHRPQRTLYQGPAQDPTPQTQVPTPQHSRVRPQSSPTSRAPSQPSQSQPIPSRYTPQYPPQYPSQGYVPIAATQQPPQPQSRSSAPETPQLGGNRYQQPYAISTAETSLLGDRSDARTAPRARTGSRHSSTFQENVVGDSRSHPRVNESDRCHVPVFINTPSVAPTISALEDTESLAPSEACGEPPTYWESASTARSANTTRAPSSTAGYRPPPTGYNNWNDAYDDAYYPEDVSEGSSSSVRSVSRATESGPDTHISSNSWTYGSGSSGSQSSRRQRTDRPFTPQLASLPERQVVEGTGNGQRTSSNLRRHGSGLEGNGSRRGSRAPNQSGSAQHLPTSRDSRQGDGQKLPSVAEESGSSSGSYFSSEYETDNGTEDDRGVSAPRQARRQSSRRTYSRQPPSATDSDEAARRLLEELEL